MISGKQFASKHRKIFLCFTIMLCLLNYGYSQVTFTPIAEEFKKIELNGTWKFCPKADKDFYSSAKKQSSSWNEIKVPACWVMQGFKVDTNQFASYYRTFVIPKSWSGNRIKLRNEGAYSVAKVFINNQYVGTHEGGMTPYEFDITPYIKIGTNDLAIAVKAQSMADTLGCIIQYLNYPMGGIIRDIYLFAVPEININSVHIETDFDNDFKNATLNLDCKIVNQSNFDTEKLKIKYTLLDSAGQAVNTASVDLNSLPAHGKSEERYSLPVVSPTHWNPEKPYLYTFKIELSEAGIIRETICKKIGFREIQVVGNKVFVNGQPIKLRGVNRHETHPLLGRSLTRELRLKDAILFKEANVNYIRTSHYPPSDEFISICDSLGFFVELENPFCWVGHGASAASSTLKFEDPEIYKYLRTTSMETIEHYRNHPSILIWSLANESNWSENWNNIKQLYDSLDMSRPKTFHDQAYGDYNNYGSTCMEIANIHYPGPHGPEVAQHFDRPLLFGEYCHLNVYNRQEVYTDPQVRDDWGEVFESIWEDMYRSEGCLGGAIWSGIDDVFLFSDSTATGYGPWGPLDGWRRTKPEYWQMKNVYSPIKVFSKYANYNENSNEIRLQVDNRNIYTNLNEIKITWSVENESGNIVSNILPLSSGWITIIPNTTKLTGKKLRISFISPSGYLIIQYEIPIGKTVETPIVAANAKNEKYTIAETDEKIVITGKKFTCFIDQKTGMISSVVSDKKTFIQGGPGLMVLGLKSNECAPKFIINNQPINSTLTNWTLENIENWYGHDSLIIKVKGKYDEASGSIEYVFNNEGEFNVNYKFEMNIDINPRQYGLLFQLNNDFKTLKWERNAQWTVYPENHIGRPKGSVTFKEKSKYNNIWNPETEWKDDANELGSNDFRSTRKNIIWAQLADENGTGIKIVSNGKQSVRVFKNNTGFGMLVADYQTGGGEMFIGAEYEAFRKPLKKGDVITGSIAIQILK